MRFALSDEQLVFRDAVRDLLAKECPPAVVRAAADAPVGELDRRAWDALGAMGVLDLLVAEDAGGLGLDETYLVPLLEECGRVALPHPVVETAMVAAPLLGAGIGMVATDLGGPMVSAAADADVLLISDDASLVALDRDQATEAGLVLTPVDTVDRGRRAATLSVAPGAPRADRQWPIAANVIDDPAAVALAFDRGALGTAAVLLGLGQAMLDMTVEYVKERHQFGKPIGSFQAVKHHLASSALALEMARPVVWRAGWSVAQDEAARSRDVSAAKAMASDAAQLIARHALQCHGAIGYTVEHDLHLFMKRTWALARSWGDSAFHTDRVADAIGA